MREATSVFSNILENQIMSKQYEDNKTLPMVGSKSPDPETVQLDQHVWRWEDDAHNPYNWPRWKKHLQCATVSILGFSCSVGTSIISPARSQLIETFDVSGTVAFLPLSLYVLALGLGPIIGGPLSETAGRLSVHTIAVVLGGLFSLGAGLTNSFGGLCIMRFLSGFFWGPTLAIGSGVISEVYHPVDRGLPTAVFILSPFLGPGLGPVLGVFIVDGKDWRWIQYTLAFLAAFCLLWLPFPGETFHPILIRRRMRSLGLTPPPQKPYITTIRRFLTVGLLRPLHMMFFEPIVAYLCLYIACTFGTLFMFFGAFFYLFRIAYDFTPIQCGLVFLAIAFGCIIGCLSMFICDKLLYQPHAQKSSSGNIPLELRLYPAMFSSFGIPISLFWFAWSAKEGVNPAVPIIAVVLFGWSNIMLTISSIQYLGDIYDMSIVASAAAANGLARYGFAAAFPLFSVLLYERLGTGWATSLLGFVTLALLPGPWLLYWYGDLN
ncbi:Citrinin biosynthesis cluster MFS transporter mrr1 [Elsinoe fawcettii]|nr:Citrinin biosynthesis cluster MFS transporter mrr1 [Elsinoe fawcettii]